MKIQLPDKVHHIITTLQDHGYEAYAVGGCVRDSILGRDPQDWDITTSATPLETKALFERTFDTGIEHGTITVLLEKEGFEVTTYRIDGKYEDSRHPKEVQFTRSLEEDLKRRDFTINAMAYNEEAGLVDIFDGLQDLDQKVIRCVGNAGERFSEDALRILRAVRFSAQLGFDIEEKTREAISDLASNLRNISAERIQVELVKLLVSPHPERIRLAYELGITSVILPEFDVMMVTEQENLHHCYHVGEHTIHTMMNIAPEKVLRLTMLFHDMGKPATKSIDEKGVAHFRGHVCVSEEIARRILQRLKFDNDTIRKVSKLVRFHDYRMPAASKYVRRAMNRIGEDLFPYYLLVQRADIAGQSEYQKTKKIENLEQIEKLYKEILELKQCVSLKGLAVTGRDLIEAGMEPGPQIGEMLETLLKEVIDDPEKNEKKVLIKMVSRGIH